ncbi:Dynactin subunit 1 [Podochytrium sp. JEL0797]|nr:Dynactin subunit 1 [Podochytrium sp. JEL0797]
MGQGISTDAHLPVKDIYRYCAKGFSVAEVEFAFRRYRALKAPILTSDYLSNAPPLNLPAPIKGGAPPVEKDKQAKGKLPLQKGAKVYVDNKSEAPLFAEQLKLDWLLNRVFYTLFPSGKEISFDEYMSKLAEWKAFTMEDRIKFLFKVLDHDQDSTLTPSDLSLFLSQITHHKYTLLDRVRLRADGRTGTVRHVGETKFATGYWIGLELDTPAGKHNGTVQGVKYFTCENLRGVFVSYARVELVEWYAVAEEVCDSLSGVVGGKGGVRLDKFREALLGDSCYRSELDTVEMESLKTLYELEQVAEKLNVKILKHFYKSFRPKENKNLESAIKNFNSRGDADGADYRSAYNQLCDWFYGWDVSNEISAGMGDEDYALKRVAREIHMIEAGEIEEATRIMRTFETL